MSEIKCFTGVLESFIEADRIPVIEAVCDAIEGFCEGRCEWFRAGTNGPAINALIYRPMWHPGYFPGRHFLQLPTVCQYCKHETFERFDIVKEEGV